MMKLLVLQSRITATRIERERANFTRAVGGLAQLEFLSTLDEKLAWASPDQILKDCSGVIFGGSSDFDFHGGRQKNDPLRLTSMIILTRAKWFVTYAMSRNIPILGVCFGHQIIAQMHGGNVMHDMAQTKFGSYQIQLTPEGKKDPLFGALPENFFAQYAHKDSATELPEGATLLASGERCRFSALRYGKNAYTVQFHPEIPRMPTAMHDSPEASSLVQKWIQLFA